MGGGGGIRIGSISGWWKAAMIMRAKRNHSEWYSTMRPRRSRTEPPCDRVSEMRKAHRPRSTLREQNFLWHALRYGTPTKHNCRDE